MNLLGFLCEDNQFSYARVVGFTSVVYCMIFGGKIAVVTHQLPDLPFGWMTLAIFAYGIGKAPEIIQAYKGNKP